MNDWLGPPKAHDNAIVLFADENYAPAAAFVCQRAIELAKERNFDVVLGSFDRGVVETVVRYYPEIRGILVDEPDSAMNEVLPRGWNITVSCVGRLLAAERLAGEYRRILYLDCDVFIEGEELGTLFELDLEGHPLAAVRAFADISERDTTPWQSYRKSLGLSADSKYFGSGVMLIDPTFFAGKNGITEKCVKALLDRDRWLPYIDQSALNLVIDGNFLELSPRWNWEFTLYASPEGEVAVQPIVRHFLLADKPWKDLECIYDRRFIDQIRAFATNSPWPDFGREAERHFDRSGIRGYLENFGTALRVLLIERKAASRGERKRALRWLAGPIRKRRAYSNPLVPNAPRALQGLRIDGRYADVRQGIAARQNDRDSR